MIAEPPGPAEVRIFDLVRTFEEVLEKVRRYRPAESIAARELAGSSRSIGGNFRGISLQSLQ
jgi:hypothetical protein